MDTLVQRLKRAYAEFDQSSMPHLQALYAPHVTFIDPLNEISGRDALLNHFAQSFENVEFCHFEFDTRNEIIGSNQALLNWVMDYRHNKLNAGNAIRVHGASFVREQQQQIVYHRDWFDLGEMLYENVPLLGTVVRLLKKKLVA